MVLWEITLATAYFLGLKRTYRLALKIQRKIVGRKHPKVRLFLQGKTRAIFDVALKVHKNIQERDIEVGRNLGNWMLRWLDRMKPSAQIRGSPEVKPLNGARSNINTMKQVTNTSHLKNPGSIQNPRNQESDRRLFSSTRNSWYKPFPTIVTMIRSPRLTGIITTQSRQLSTSGPELLRSNYQLAGQSRFNGVFRQDIMQYLLH